MPLQASCNNVHPQRTAVCSNGIGSVSGKIRIANLRPLTLHLPDGSQRIIVAVEVKNFEEQFQAWDCAFKDLETSDYVVGQVWGRVGSDFLLLDQMRGKMDLPATVKAVREMSARWPGSIAKFIEDKANGSAVVQMLHKEIPGIIPVNPQGGKVSRAAASIQDLPLKPTVSTTSIAPPISAKGTFHKKIGFATREARESSVLASSVDRVVYGAGKKDLSLFIDG